MPLLGWNLKDFWIAWAQVQNSAESAKMLECIQNAKCQLRSTHQNLQDCSLILVLCNGTFCVLLLRTGSVNIIQIKAWFVAVPTGEQHLTVAMDSTTDHCRQAVHLLSFLVAAFATRSSNLWNENLWTDFSDQKAFVRCSSEKEKNHLLLAPFERQTSPDLGKHVEDWHHCGDCSWQAPAHFFLLWCMTGQTWCWFWLTEVLKVDGVTKVCPQLLRTFGLCFCDGAIKDTTPSWMLPLRQIADLFGWKGFVVLVSVLNMQKSFTILVPSVGRVGTPWSQWASGQDPAHKECQNQHKQWHWVKSNASLQINLAEQSKSHCSLINMTVRVRCHTNITSINPVDSSTHNQQRGQPNCPTRRNNNWNEKHMQREKHWSRFNRLAGAPLHAKQEEQLSCSTDRRRSTFDQQVNRRIAKIKRVSVECWLCEIDPPLHSLNKRDSKIADKTRGNHSSRSRLCHCVAPNGWSSRNGRIESTVSSTIFDTLLSLLIWSFESTFGCLQPCSTENIKKAVASSTADRKEALLRHQKEHQKEGSLIKKKGSSTIKKKHSGPVKNRVTEKKRTWSAMQDAIWCTVLLAAAAAATAAAVTDCYP